MYNRLVQYTEGSVKETYTYDAEGVRRSKENGDETVYYISDTTGSLSYTLAETDKDGNVIATYNRADVLISQVREETTSYYLFDGHGDVRALINDAGRITDKYRYNAYGELIERSGETENHYLYTGEYYDGTSNLYYLRARYMNPSTGTFISMDTYEGSIYDPDTLHKYLYANGNPVKYSDPTGNFSAVTMAAGMAINDCITTAYNVHLMGILSGLSNMAVNSILGKQGVGLVTDFFEGYQSGVWTAGILYLTAAISVKAFAAVAFGMSAVDVIMSLVLLVASVNEKNTKGILVYGTLLVMSIVSTYQTYDMCGVVNVMGDKGNARIEVNNLDTDIDKNIFQAPSISINSRGELTNGTYTLNQADMKIHVDGKNPNKSQFLYNVDENKAVLETAAYADQNNLWTASSGNPTDFPNKAKVYVENGPVGVTGKGKLTNYVNVYRTKTNYVHGCPGN